MTDPPTAGTVWRTPRAPVLLALLLIAVAVAAAVTHRRGPTGELDPAAADPAGARALATLLRDRGVTVTRTETAAEAIAAAGTAGTVFVPVPARLPPDRLGALPGAGRDVVLVAPQEEDLASLRLSVSTAGAAPVRTRAPGCALPVAAVAGGVDLGGTTYTPTPSTGGSVRPDTQGCYPAGRAPSLLSMPADGDRVTLVGAAEPFSNDRLDEQGNAALALGLLGGRDRVAWLLPRPGAGADGGELSLLDLLPERVRFAVLQLAVGVGLLALWRARRLGPVVREPLPVVVRAAETVEGRAGLYRAAGARDRVADALHAGARVRLAPVLDLPGDARPQALVEAAARRTGRSPREVGELLYGAPPGDDAGLVRLADALDALDREVRRP